MKCVTVLLGYFHYATTVLLEYFGLSKMFEIIVYIKNHNKIQPQEFGAMGCSDDQSSSLTLIVCNTTDKNVIRRVNLEYIVNKNI